MEFDVGDKVRVIKEDKSKWKRWSVGDEGVIKANPMNDNFSIAVDFGSDYWFLQYDKIELIEDKPNTSLSNTDTKKQTTKPTKPFKSWRERDFTAFSIATSQ